MKTEKKRKVLYITIIFIITIIIGSLCVLYLNQNFATGNYSIIDLDIASNSILVGQELIKPIYDSKNNFEGTTPYIQEYRIFLAKYNLILDSNKKKVEISNLQKGDNIFIIRKTQKFTASIWSQVIPLKNVFFIMVKKD